MSEESNHIVTQTNQLLDDVKQFFEQEKTFFGDTFYVEAVEHPPLKISGTESQISIDMTHSHTDKLWKSADSLESLNKQICSCQECPLGQTRKNFVFGVGNPNTKVMVIGEAPGADEDEQGEPFVGRAGQLLNKILEAIHFKREDVFICNILKCRPPNNRDPLPEEVDKCEPYLWKQIEIIHPLAILCVGRIAGQTLLKTTRGLGELRGTVHSYQGIPMMITYHPAALLRNPNWKRPTWEDVQQFRALYDKLMTEGVV